MNTDPTSAEERIRAVKLGKIAALREAGVNPYPERFERTHTLTRAAQLPPGTEGVRIAGRMVSRREFGKLAFFDLQDAHGRCQASIAVDRVGKDDFKQFSKRVDIGDFVGVEGDTDRTQKGLPVLKTARWQLLGKTLRPLPEKYHAIHDPELRYRRRYLDLIMDADTRRRFELRHNVMKQLRATLDAHGFYEVETPVLESQPSGALATPFRTHHNALDIDLFLRIAPETWLKRCIVAGYDRVYEFARVFRNEGMDPSHLQEFTMLEYYAAYWNYVDNMDFTEMLVRETLRRCLGTLEVEIAGERVDFGQPWPRRPLLELIEEHSGIDVTRNPSAEELRGAMQSRNIAIEGAERLGWGALVDQLYKKVARPHLIQPMFVTSHPVELSPLARSNDDRPHLSDRFQLLIRGWEVVNAYSELVDPVDQRQRLGRQAELNAAGDDQAMVMDEDYLLAMEYGMPPISGWGMGIDRFVAVLCGAENLRDVVLFPLMKPEAPSESSERKSGSREG